MALIEINIPEETEPWEDSLAARLLLLALGLLLFRFGFRVWSSLMPEDIVGAIAAVSLFAVGTQLLVFSVSDLPIERWGPRISWAVLLALVLATVAVLFRGMLPRISTDAMLFSVESVEKLQAGKNPYRVDMRPAIRKWRGPRFATPRIDGTVVHSLSYPAGAVVWFLPQALTVGPTAFGYRLTLLVPAVATAAVLINDLPPALAPAGLIGLLAGRNLILTAAGGVLWPLWVLPLLLGARNWHLDRRLRAAFWVGIAAGTKQHAWLILPFLAIWVWHESDSFREFAHDGGRLIGVGAGGFLLLNLPFIVWDPAAWVQGILTPVGGSAPLVHQGGGLALLAYLGVAPLPQWWFTLAVAGAFATVSAAYFLYWEDLKWAAWILPSVIYLFHTRSLGSYFLAWGPLAAFCALAQWDRVSPGGLPLPSPITTPEVAADAD